MDKNSWCPLIQMRCVGAECVCCHPDNVGFSEDKILLTCIFFNCKMGESLQPPKIAVKDAGAKA